MIVHNVDACGQSGDILVLKHNGSNIIIIVHYVFMNIITIKLSLGTFSWYVTVTYSSLVYTSRLHMCLHLIDWRNTVDGPWMMIEDFNDIIHLSEQNGGNFNHSRTTDLLNVIDKCNLVEVDMTRGKFTYNRPCIGNRMVYYKLDKALVDFSWHIVFPNGYVDFLCKFHYDHNHILFRCGLTLQENRLRPFRFEAS